MGTDQFHRTRLLLGEDGLNRLRRSHVMVIGCGAVGSFAVEALARAGIGHLSLADGDTVQESNINRQLCALHSTLGQMKVAVLQQRISDICPDTHITTYNRFITPDTCDDFFHDIPDFVVDAIDSVPDKIALILYLQKHNIPFMSSMGAALKTDPSAIKTAPLNQTSVCPLAAKIRKAVKQAGADTSFPCVFSTEPPQPKQDTELGSLITITGCFGLMIANSVIQRILHA